MSKYIDFQFILLFDTEKATYIVQVIRGIYQERTCVFMMWKTTRKID